MRGLAANSVKHGRRWRPARAPAGGPVLEKGHEHGQSLPSTEVMQAGMYRRSERPAPTLNFQRAKIRAAERFALFNFQNCAAERACDLGRRRLR